jgi:hypothetical protein
LKRFHAKALTETKRSAKKLSFALLFGLREIKIMA